MGVALVGIELEGMWVDKNRVQIRDSGTKVNWQSDGSVLILEHPDTTGEDYHGEHLKKHGLKCKPETGIQRLPLALGVPNWFHIGEVTSDPLGSKTEIITAWLKDAYPAAMNQTCGMHLHISFTTKGFYYRAVSQSYFAAVYQHFLVWGTEHNIKHTEFWKRLNGENSFCRKEYRPDRQVWSKGKGEARYCGINYCYSRYKTIEIRLLPMFKDWNLAALAINDFIAFTNKFLASSKLQTIHEEINEQIPASDHIKAEVLKLKKMLGAVSNSADIVPLSLARGPQRTNDARESLRRHVLAALGPTRQGRG